MMKNRKKIAKTGKSRFDYFARRLFIFAAFLTIISSAVFIPLTNSVVADNRKREEVLESYLRTEDILTYQVATMLSKEKVYQTLVDLHLIETD